MIRFHSSFINKERNVIGIDLKSYEIGDKFRGIYGIPNGIRFLHINQTFGIFINVGDREVFDCDSNFQIIKSNDFMSDQLPYGFGIYDQCSFSDWDDLFGYVNINALRRCGIEPGKPIDNVCFTSLREVMGMASDAKQGSGSAQLLLKGCTNFTDIAMDPSELFRRAINVYYNESIELFLGEFQLAFILFMYISNFEALEFWKNSVHLVCSSADWQTLNEEQALEVIHALKFQIQLLPSDFFVDELLQDSCLTPAFATMLSNSSMHTEIAHVIKSHHGAGILHKLENWDEEQDGLFQMQSLCSENTSSRLEMECDNEDQVESQLSDHVSQTKPVERMSWMLAPL